MLRGRLSSLPLYALLLIGVFVVVAAATGGYYAYKTYDYVEHDNDFCFSCHLMQEPYELFAQSAHRGLGCKACHQPNVIERGSMGVTAIVDNPDSISVHSEVPNEVCASCHIEGDPEQWTLIASSAGHRVHLESDDPELEGLQCVECHSSSLHQFTAADETCAQSGCHTESDIQLGAMGDFTIHCAACHAFSAPVVDLDQAGALAALAPDEDTCLSCHAMRQLVDMPEPDPHENACGACHDPHDQATPEAAVQSCATSECHAEPLDLSPFHRGLEEAVVADCMSCHQAHDFQIDGSDCRACHTNIMDDDPSAIRPAAHAVDSLRRRADASRTTLEASAYRLVVAELGDEGTRVVAPVAGPVHGVPGVGTFHPWGHPLPQSTEFRHSEHPSVDCRECHESVEEHGRITVVTVSDCRSCHHVEETIEPDGCAACHEDSHADADPYAVERAPSFSTGIGRSRALSFDHGSHLDEDCATCHTEGLELSAAGVDCASCHEEHHDPVMDCMSCHLPTEEGVHVVETAHVTCSGAGCHTDVPFEGVPRTNQVCLSCHQDMVDHRPGESCAECHALTEVVGGAP